MPLLQSMWIGSRLSQLEILSITSFLKAGHDYHLYVYDDIGNLPPGVTIRSGEDILPRDEIFAYKRGRAAGSFSAFSNLFRYKLLADRGGFWVDTDVVCLKPFDFRTEYVFGQERTRIGSFRVASCVVGCPRDSPFARHCLDASMAADRETLQWGKIGPELVTQAVAKYALESFVLPPSAFCPSDWWRTGQEIVGPLGKNVDLTESYAIHFWNEMWRRNGFDKDGHHDPDSLHRIVQSSLIP